MFLPTIQQIDEKNLHWINVSKTGVEEIKFLEETYKFHPIHLVDCASPIQRPKLDITNDYIFMVLLFPIYHKKTRQITPAEVDFFIGPDYLITVHNNELPSLINFFNLCQISSSHRKKYLTGNPMLLLYEILNRLFKYCRPLLENLYLSVASIEDNIFRGYERRMVREILVAKKNVVNLRHILQVHRSVINKLINKGERLFSVSQIKMYFLQLTETVSEMWDMLENIRQTVEDFEQTNNALISFRLTDIMKTLATISVIVLPISLLTGIFGMGLKSTPFWGSPYGFWIISGLIVIVVTTFVFYLKHRRWL